MEVQGVVIDKDNDEPLPFANVLVKGTALGAATDKDGKFAFVYVTDKEFTIVVRFMGYKTQEQQFFPDDDVSNLRFELLEDVFDGEVIVVTGIASRTSKEVAEIAVSHINAAELTAMNSYQELSQLVAAKIPGVRIEPASGNVASGIRFNMRSGGGLNGDEQPIVYIDGIRIDTDEYGGDASPGIWTGGQGIGLLSTINPEDIENIEILKGPAAAASYGTGGSNGVVLITTKRGKVAVGEAKAVSISYRFLSGLNTQGYEYEEEDFTTAKYVNGIHHEGPISQHSLSASGGAEKVRYYIGIDGRTEHGLMLHDYMNRKTLRTNFDAFPDENIILRASASYTQTENRRPETDDNEYSWIGQNIKWPLYPYIDSVAIASINTTSNMNRFLGSAQASWIPIDGLEATASFGIDEYDLIDNELYPPGYAMGATGDFGRKDVQNRQNTQNTFEANVRYRYSPLQGLTINSMAGTQLFERRIRTSRIRKLGFLTSLITDVGAGEDYVSGSENRVHYKEAGIFTDHAISYLDQYYFSFMIRKDYASTIGKEAPSIIYPRASLAVRLDKYSFMPSLFSLLKIRAAYGETGVLPGRLDGIRLLWEGVNSPYGVGGQISSIGNEEIEPERIKELEIGFEAELLRNYSAEFTYYQQRAENSIVDYFQAYSTGITAGAFPTNIGKVKGWGIESLIQARPVRSKNFQLDLSLTNSYQTNEVIDMGDAQPIFGGRDLNVIKEGLSKHAFYHYKIKGATFLADGRYKGVDADTAKSYLGTPLPPYTGSFSLNARIFKNFNFNLLLDWATGHSIANYNRRGAIRYDIIPRHRELKQMLGIDVMEIEEGYEDKDIEPFAPGSPEYIEAANEYATYNREWLANFIEPADYLNLREISISYSFADLLQKFKIPDLVVGLSARNIWRTKKYSYPSIEVNADGARSLDRGVDYYTVQTPRVYNLWFRLSL
jgi:TonB-dependent SusC/RagA subfamily outer membrane receptor